MLVCGGGASANVDLKSVRVHFAGSKSFITLQ